MAIAVQTEAVLVETRDCQWPVCRVHMPRKSVKIAALPSESRSCRWKFWRCTICPLYKVCLSYFIFIFIFIEFPTFQFKMAPLKPVRALVLLVAMLLVSELLVSPALAEVNISARIDYILYPHLHPAVCFWQFVIASRLSENISLDVIFLSASPWSGMFLAMKYKTMW